jgi:predicted outer membrane protein
MFFSKAREFEMRFGTLITTSACGAVLSCGLFAGAQQAQPAPQAQPARPGQPVQQRPGVQVQQPGVQVQVGGQVHQGQWQGNDHMLATCAAIDNQEEIALAKFAEKKASKKEVKEFAEMIAKDHKDFLQKLQRFAPEATGEGFLMERQNTNENSRDRSAQAPRRENEGNIQKTSATDRKETREVAQAGGAVQNENRAAQPAQPGQQQPRQQIQPGQQAQQPLDMAMLHKEIAEQCLADAKHEMDKKDGDKFDECFIGHQIAKHAAMKEKLTVFQRHSTPELAQLFAEGSETTQKHLKKAEKIMEDLRDSSSSNSKSSDSKK